MYLCRKQQRNYPLQYFYCRMPFRMLLKHVSDFRRPWHHSIKPDFHYQKQLNSYNRLWSIGQKPENDRRVPWFHYQKQPHSDRRLSVSVSWGLFQCCLPGYCNQRQRILQISPANLRQKQPMLYRWRYLTLCLSYSLRQRQWHYLLSPCFVRPKQRHWPLWPLSYFLMQSYCCQSLLIRSIHSWQWKPPCHQRCTRQSFVKLLLRSKVPHQ